MQRGALLESDFGTSQSDCSALVAWKYQFAMSISVPHQRIEGGVRILVLPNPWCRRKVIDGLESIDRRMLSHQQPRASKTDQI